jgi:hypothetical protein
MLKFLFKYTFVDNDFCGYVRFEYAHNDIEFTFNDGEINNLNVVGPIKLLPAPMPKFLSKETRLVSSIVQYMKMKSALKLPKHLSDFLNDSQLEELLNLYRIYDIFFMEHFIYKIKDEVIIDNSKIDFEKYGMQLYSIKADFENNDILCKKKKDDNYASVGKLSAGEQSLITIFLSTAL